MFKIPTLRIGNIETKIPIIQGGMGVGISLSSLASAVAKEGGIGVISGAEVGMLDPEFTKHPRQSNIVYLQNEIRKAKSQTNGIIGVNLMVVLSDYDELIKVCVKENVDVIFAGAGLPLKPIQYIMPDEKNIHTKIVPIVSSAKAASLIFKYWAKHYNKIPDGVVVEGPMAGGHLGFKLEQLNDPNYKLEKIVPQVIKAIKEFEKAFNKNIPVIAAGGIYTGYDIYKFIKMGASGIQMATRFVATYECDAAQAFKEAYIKAKKENTIIIKSPVGLPGRAIKNEFLEKVNANKTTPFKCAWYCIKGCDFRKAPYCITSALVNAQQGNLDKGFAFAGVNVYKIDKIISVKELISTLLKEYEEAFYIDHTSK